MTEEQAEELEALTSIYDGDTFYKQINPTTFQYKYGEEGSEKSFMIEISWPEAYPNELPKISLDLYYNRNMSDTLKSKITDILKAEGENWIGCGMTYTLFECIKEQLSDLLDELEKELQEAASAVVSEKVKKMDLGPVIQTTPTELPVKKEQLTKSQKRRMWERTDNKGQRQRGWDWVDIVRHLSQTGHKDDSVAVASNPSQQQPLAPPPRN